MKYFVRTIVNKHFFSTLFFLLLFSISTKTINAQSLWLIDTTNRAINIELMKPFFEGGEDISFFSTSQIISGKFRMSDKLFLVSELPFASFASEVSDSEFTYGNPYLGFMFYDRGGSYFFEGGLRFPIANEEKSSALFLGYFTDFDRLEAYVPDLLSISLKNSFIKKNSANYLLKAMAGISFWIPRGENPQDNEVLLDYGIHTGYDGNKVQLLGGITGRLIVTVEDADIGERTLHNFGASARYKFKKAQPGLMLRVPLDEDFGDFINLIMGFNLTINLD